MRSATFLSPLAPIALVLMTAAPALAGPPLVCFPFDIGTARSLPWDTGARTWKAMRADYKVSSLTGDTLSLLTPGTPVIVRMETLRRAAIYATTDAAAGRALLQTLLDRARAKGSEPLASFDAGYLAATYKQLEPISPATAALASGIDGYGLVQASLQHTPADPAVAFAAALVAADGHRAAALQHERTARAGAPADVLLAKNIDHLDHGIPR
jgi:hypothetical protein